MKKIALKNAARGTAFDYAGQSWILLENDPAGRTLCLSKDITETRAFDEGNCNNFAVASSNKYLNGPYLDNLVDACNGTNAFLESELDLTTDDGLNGLRPACYLDSDLLISVEDDEATDDVTPEHAGEIIAALAEQFGGTFATEDQLTTALSFMLGTLRATREKEARHE